MLAIPESREWTAAREILQALRAAGFEALLAGGAVRNALLNLPAKDFDLATSARPEEVAKLFPKCQMVGAQFGVAVVVRNGIQTEVATFRRDGRYLDSRHPVAVEFSSAEQDALRRDFTINAMFYDPFEDRVIDYVGGQADLRARQLRAVGNPNERYQEDALRMLRAVRFAHRFDFTIERRTKQAIRRYANLLRRISRERIRDELAMMLTGPRPDAAVEQMLRLGILQIILPEVVAMDGVEQPPEFHPEGDVFRHTMLCLKAMRSNPTLTLAFGVLLHDVGKPPTFTIADRIRFNEHAPVGAEMADKICRRLHFSNDDRKQVCHLVKDHMRFLDVQRMKRSTLRRFLSKPRIEEDLELHRVDCVSSHGSLENYEFCLKALEDLRSEGQSIAPAPLVNGDDLLALEQSPGPQFKQWLQEIHDLQLEGRVQTREEALAALKQIIGT